MIFEYGFSKGSVSTYPWYIDTYTNRFLDTALFKDTCFNSRNVIGNPISSLDIILDRLVLMLLTHLQYIFQLDDYTFGISCLFAHLDYTPKKYILGWG